MVALAVLLLAGFLPGLICERRAPALIVFGDSIVDTGNNNLLPTFIKSNFPPYGQDFVGREPTGRFSNGKIPSDFLASLLGIKEYLPPYLGTKLSPEDLLTGVSFASGGNGFDPLTSRLVSALSIKDQLKLFKEYSYKVKAIAGAEQGESILSEAVYIVCTGTDDIANTYFTTPFRQPFMDLPSYIQMTTRLASAFLVSLGARRIGFVSLPPIGCIPSQRTLGGGVERDCEPRRNEAAEMFNSEMTELLNSLSAKYPGSRIVFLDIYSPLLDMIKHPQSYGFIESRRGCCGTGTIEAASLCNPLTPITCLDDAKYLFWDSYHLTQRAYQLLNDILGRRYNNQF
ncbi:GDSL esterase/lipase At3g14820-like [Wolffia australiana]